MGTQSADGTCVLHMSGHFVMTLVFSSDLDLDSRRVKSFVAAPLLVASVVAPNLVTASSKDG